MTSALPAVARGEGSPTLEAFRVTQNLANTAVPAVADIAVVEVSDSVLCEHTALSGVCEGIGFRRAAFRGVRHPGCAYRIGEACSVPSGTPYRRSLRDLRPRIVSPVPAQARWLARDPVRAAVMRENGVHSLIVVPLAVNRVVLGFVAFYRRGGSSPFRQADLRAAASLAGRTAQILDVVRRDVQEQGMGRRFQQALLAPPPHLTAIEEVSGHVPENGTPGGWFDVIRLPSARVGLVAGFCGGHGITAATAMSQQKARIRALAVLSQDPAEVLTRGLEPPADELDAQDQPSLAGHCVYAVYDPVTRRCTAAHTSQARLTMVDADGAQSVGASAQEPESSATCNVTEFDVPPGSVLALSSPSPQELHHTVPGGQPRSDQTDPETGPRQPAATPVVTLTAQTRATAPTDIATWDLSNEPSVVAEARARAAAQLTSWGLPDLSFTVTLVVSELVTNAIRYSTGPIQLRLIRDHVLICEVADTSRAAPHAGEPAPSEQGGRGLSIVNHLTQGYGTRYTPSGKIVWTELSLYQS
ncbi:ATP-binding SpoIIE family protein phosphatase [Streptomyces fagopyri]|uniref:ATP-binding SpoIIE family protein phosphatase n=1 Tax=Streptomyces fagopyri TaxID=2662397 RepID=UPI0033F9F9D1